jgi:hypothetical protein
MFAIHSSSSDRELRFLARNGDVFQVELVGRELTVAHEVSAYTDSKGLLALFEKLAAQVGPWRGAESWTSLEGEFSLIATCSTSGHVHFQVELQGGPGAPEEWRASAGITSELGQLQSIAAAARSFFDDASA